MDLRSIEHSEVVKLLMKPHDVLKIVALRPSIPQLSHLFNKISPQPLFQQPTLTINKSPPPQQPLFQKISPQIPSQTTTNRSKPPLQITKPLSPQPAPSKQETQSSFRSKRSPSPIVLLKSNSKTLTTSKISTPKTQDSFDLANLSHISQNNTNQLSQLTDHSMDSILIKTKPKTIFNKTATIPLKSSTPDFDNSTYGRYSIEDVDEAKNKLMKNENKIENSNEPKKLGFEKVKNGKNANETSKDNHEEDDEDDNDTLKADDDDDDEDDEFKDEKPKNIKKPIKQKSKTKSENNDGNSDLTKTKTVRKKKAKVYPIDVCHLHILNFINKFFRINLFERHKLFEINKS